jgi:hypothetical protein
MEQSHMLGPSSFLPAAKGSASTPLRPIILSSF